MVGVDGTSGPLMPIGTKSVSLHAIVDHESKPLPLHLHHVNSAVCPFAPVSSCRGFGAVIESIYNNRTAMVTYNKNIPSATSTSAELYGTGAGIKAGLKTWSLDAANNLGPQP